MGLKISQLIVEKEIALPVQVDTTSRGEGQAALVTKEKERKGDVLYVRRNKFKTSDFLLLNSSPVQVQSKCKL